MNNEPHPNIAMSLNNIGGVYNDIGNTKKALDFYNKSLDMFKKRFYNNESNPRHRHVFK